MNGPNKLERYITQGWNDLPGTNSTSLFGPLKLRENEDIIQSVVVDDTVDVNRNADAFNDARRKINNLIVLS